MPGVSVSRYRPSSRLHMPLTSFTKWPCSGYAPSKALPITNRSRAITIGGSTMSQAPGRTFDQALLLAWQEERTATPAHLSGASLESR
jgi:hypothetical protein